MVEPQAQLVYQSVDLDTTRDIAATVRFDEVESLARRHGVRFAGTRKKPGGIWGLSQPGLVTAWFRPSYWHEFSGDPKTLFSSATGFIPFRADHGGAWVELNSRPDRVRATCTLAVRLQAAVSEPRQPRKRRRPSSLASVERTSA